MPQPSESQQQTNVERAIASYDAMQTHFGVPGTPLYRETAPWTGGNPYAYLWPFSRALVGTLALAGVPSRLLGGRSYVGAVQERLNGLAEYWYAPAYESYVVSAGGGDTFYDDNAWVALAQVQEYRMGLSTSLDRPDQLFSFARSGWDRLRSDPHPGGVFWVKQSWSGLGLSNHDRGAGLNAGYARLGLSLHELTGSTSYDGDGVVAASPAALGATNMFNWVNACLDSSTAGSGLYWNAIRRDGSTDTNIWSYVQGEMVGANVLHHRLSGNGVYLQHAQDIARKTLSHFGTFTRHPPSFNAMCFQNLLLLHAHTSDTTLQSSITDAMQAYADWAWTNASVRDPRTSLFYFTDAGQPAARGSQPSRLQDQGAMAHLYALLAWTPTDYTRLA